MSVVIRPAVPADVPRVAELLLESAIVQGSPGSLVVDAESLLRDGFGPQPRFHLLVAESDQRLAGLALYFFNYSTWISTKGLYLEDLYVSPEFRRHGIARNLMRRLAQVAKQEACGRFQWSVLRSNHSAIRFYQSVGAHVAEEWAWMGMYGNEIKRLAEE
jgi:GNAT superfamily N-acetyltransferase